jgi:hypothetical protein
MTLQILFKSASGAQRSYPKNIKPCRRMLSPRFTGARAQSKKPLIGGLGAAGGCFSSRGLRYEPQTMKR